MSTIPVNINFFSIGSTFCLNLDSEVYIKNNGPDIASNVQVEFTLPAGVDWNPGASNIGGRGTLDEGTDSLLAGECLNNASFCFIITDDCAGPFDIVVNVTSDACECNIENNSICWTVDGVSCCDAGECLALETVRTIDQVAETHLATDRVILIDASSNNVTFTLLDPADVNVWNAASSKGMTIRFKLLDDNAGANIATLTTPSGKIVLTTTIAAAAATHVFSSVGEAFDLVTDGVNWYAI